jgi:hypothetical protein
MACGAKSNKYKFIAFDVFFGKLLKIPDIQPIPPSGLSKPLVKGLVKANLKNKKCLTYVPAESIIPYKIYAVPANAKGKGAHDAINVLCE